MTKEWNYRKNLKECLETLKEDLIERDFPFEHIVENFTEVLNDVFDEFIRRLKKHHTVGGTGEIIIISRDKLDELAGEKLSK